MRYQCTGLQHASVCPNSHFAAKSKLLSAPAWNDIGRRKFFRAAYKVEIQHPGGVANLEVEEGDTILQTALDAGIELSHDCKMGVCMTCPAKLVEGDVDQSAGMLDETVKEKGYTLLCVSEPRSDCIIQTIEEDEILEEVLCSSANAG